MNELIVLVIRRRGGRQMLVGSLLRAKAFLPLLLMLGVRPSRGSRSMHASYRLLHKGCWETR